MLEYHTPVLLKEVLELLQPGARNVFVDATVGGAGHAEALLERILPGGHLIGIDRDREALAEAARRLARFGDAVQLIHGRFDRLQTILAEAGAQTVDGVLVDLGVSSHQLDSGDRGFSFSRPGPLDMRMDQSSGTTAAGWIEKASEEELAQAFYRYGEERWSRRIAKQIVEARSRAPIRTTEQLADIVAGAIPRGAWQKGIHPATRVFQAIRIAVNEELEQVGVVIEQGVKSLRAGGRIGVISFHSLEDRIVKQRFASLGGACHCPPGMPVCGCGAIALVKPVTRKPVFATDEEIQRNPRSRSARLRVAEKL